MGFGEAYETEAKGKTVSDEQLEKRGGKISMDLDSRYEKSMVTTW